MRGSLRATKEEDLLETSDVTVIVIPESLELAMASAWELNAVWGWLALHHAQGLPGRFDVGFDRFSQDLDGTESKPVGSSIHDNPDELIVSQRDFPRCPRL